MAADQATTSQQDDQELNADMPETGSADIDQASSEGLDQEALQQSIASAIQPVIDELKQQITRTVQENLEKGEGSAASASAGDSFGLDDLGSLGETVQSILQAVRDAAERIWAWIIEMLQKLGDVVAETIGELAGKLVQKAVKSAF